MENFKAGIVEPEGININKADVLIERLTDSINSDVTLTNEDLWELSDMIKTLRDLQNDLSDDNRLPPAELGTAIAKLVDIKKRSGR